ncbi:MAG: response regulator [Proteobacteria bacterium]|nr:response regulator [Pseudomonadota bacterium]MBU1708497.1 response regulator [Pseudomonadota bacterium]
MTNKHNILIIDDEVSIREILQRFLTREGFICSQAHDAEEALEKLETNAFSLALCDINMPGATGIDLLRTMHIKYPQLAVIMVTAVDDRETALNALELGAYGYVIKPFEMNEMLINISNALKRRALEIEHVKHQEELEFKVLEKTKELVAAEQEIRASREETIFRLARAAEFRDNETAQHTIRMSHYCGLLANKAGLPQELCAMIQIASPLHDVGKIGISDTILMKPGKLTFEEFETIKEHSDIGYRILAKSNSSFLELAASIAHTHHEKYDGSGYPRGLKGENIPIEGRISAICDVFDALTSDRPYKNAFTVEKALEIMREGHGTHFDAPLLDLFFKYIDQTLRIRKEFADKIEH